MLKMPNNAGGERPFNLDDNPVLARFVWYMAQVRPSLQVEKLGLGQKTLNAKSGIVMLPSIHNGYQMHLKLSNRKEVETLVAYRKEVGCVVTPKVIAYSYGSDDAGSFFIGGSDKAVVVLETRLSASQSEVVTLFKSYPAEALRVMDALIDVDFAVFSKWDRETRSFKGTYSDSRYDFEQVVSRAFSLLFPLNSIAESAVEPALAAYLRLVDIIHSADTPWGDFTHPDFYWTNLDAKPDNLSGVNLMNPDVNQLKAVLLGKDSSINYDAIFPIAAFDPGGRTSPKGEDFVQLVCSYPFNIPISRIPTYLKKFIDAVYPEEQKSEGLMHTALVYPIKSIRQMYRLLRHAELLEENNNKNNIPKDTLAARREYYRASFEFYRAHAQFAPWFALALALEFKPGYYKHNMQAAARLMEEGHESLRRRLEVPAYKDVEERYGNSFLRQLYDVAFTIGGNHHYQQPPLIRRAHNPIRTRASSSSMARSS